MKALLLLAFFALSFFVALAEDVQSSPETLLKFAQYQQQFSKTYKNEEEQAYRYNVWMTNLNKLPEIRAMNPLAQFEVNEFSDLTAEEFAERYLSNTTIDQVQKEMNDLANDPKSGVAFKLDAQPPPVNLSGRYDYRDIGYVTAVKNQGQCGSCWAFAAASAIETAYCRATGQLYELSPQQILDCSGGGSCGGGYIDWALYYSTQMPIMGEGSYPYVGYQTGCRHGGGGVKMRHLIPLNNPAYNPGRPVSDDHIGNHIAAYGGLAFGIWGDLVTALSYYRGGILTGCNKQPTYGHAMTLVGWQDYQGNAGWPVWVVKNSWGSGWGEGGYVYFFRGGANVCGINEYLYAVWP